MSMCVHSSHDSADLRTKLNVTYTDLVHYIKI